MSNISRRRLLAVFASAGVVAAVPVAMQAPVLVQAPASALSLEQKFEAWQAGRDFVVTAGQRG